MGNTNATFQTDSALLPLLVFERIVHYSNNSNLRMINQDFNRLVLRKIESDDSLKSMLLMLLSIGDIEGTSKKPLISFVVIKDAVFINMYHSGWCLEVFNKIIKLPDLLFINDTRLHLQFRTKNKWVPLLITRGRIYDIKKGIFLNNYDLVTPKFDFATKLGQKLYNYVIKENELVLFSYENHSDIPYQIVLSTKINKHNNFFSFTENFHTGRSENFLDENILVMRTTFGISTIVLNRFKAHQIYIEPWFIDKFDVIGTTNNHLIFWVHYRRSTNEFVINNYNVVNKRNQVYYLKTLEFKNYSLTQSGIKYNNQNDEEQTISFEDFHITWRFEPTIVKSLIN